MTPNTRAWTLLMDLGMDLDKGGNVGTVRRTIGRSGVRRQAMNGALGDARKRHLVD
jgi:hypothetical protein